MLLPDGNITDGYIILVDFHYNIAAVEVAANLKHLEIADPKNITGRAGVLALGRAYEGCNLMCSRGQVINKTSIFGCSELLVSSCEISMVQNISHLIRSNLLWSYYTRFGLKTCTVLTDAPYSYATCHGCLFIRHVIWDNKYLGRRSEGFFGYLTYFSYLSKFMWQTHHGGTPF